MKTVVAIPTWNNPRQLIEAVTSLVRNTDFDGEIVIVNNGDPNIAGADFAHHVRAAVPYKLEILQNPSNLGWCGGINTALRHADSLYPDGDFLFTLCNDDVLFPVNRVFWTKVQEWFRSGRIVGLGPCSDYVSGYQNLNLHGMPDAFSAPLLIGFFAIYRREALNAGNEFGLDGNLPGGDDYDLSIRIAKANFSLAVDRSLFVHHRGAQTGGRVHPGWWDSQEHQRQTYMALIRKHGLLSWWKCLNGPVQGLGDGWELRHVSLSGDDSLDGLYRTYSTRPSDVFEHVKVLRNLAASSRHVTEFGTADGTTTVALMAGRPDRLVSYDIRRLPEVDGLYRLAAEVKVDFSFFKMSTLAAPIEPTDFLYIDDLHTYAQVKAELEMHAASVSKYIAFHDTETCDRWDEEGQPWVEHKPDYSDGKPHGVMTAIEEFLKSDQGQPWRIVHLVPYNNGLTVLARVGAEIGVANA